MLRFIFFVRSILPAIVFSCPGVYLFFFVAFIQSLYIPGLPFTFSLSDLLLLLIFRVHVSLLNRFSIDVLLMNFSASLSYVFTYFHVWVLYHFYFRSSYVLPLSAFLYVIVVLQFVPLYIPIVFLDSIFFFYLYECFSFISVICASYLFLNTLF